MRGAGFTLANPSPGSGGKIPLTVQKPLAAGYAESMGALLVVNAADEFAAAGADAALIAAVALTPGGADTGGYNILGRKEFPANYMQGISVANGVRFLAPFVGALPAAAGGDFGYVRDTDGLYKVDFAEVVNAVLKYLGVPDFDPSRTATAEGLVIVSVLPAAVQAI